MADTQTCPRCGLPVLVIGSHELEPRPSADGSLGVWAIRDGRPVCAVSFVPSKVPGMMPVIGGRLPGFAGDKLHESHARRCADERRRKGELPWWDPAAKGGKGDVVFPARGAPKKATGS